MKPREVSAQQVAEAVAAAMGGRAEDILVPQRGSPRAARMRWVSMYVYREVNRPRPTLEQVGLAFGRHRTSVGQAMTALRAEWSAGRLGTILQTLRQQLSE